MNPTIDETDVLAETFRLLGNPTRLKILFHCLEEPQSVTDIAEPLGLSQSLASHQLRLLRAARLVRGERKGKQVFYTLSDDHIRDLLLDMLAHIREEDGDRGFGE